MKCSKCGEELKEGAKFCENCGTAPQKQDKPVKPDGKKKEKNIVLCDDGKYRWVYDFHLMKNPSILFVILKIFFFIILGIWAFVTVIEIKSPNFWWEGFLNNTRIFGIVMLGALVLCVVSYIIYAAIMGWKYCVLFEMDDKGVKHTQLPPQVKRAEALSLITVLAGIASRNPTTVGIGLNAGARSTMYTEFAKVRHVKIYEKRGVIKLNQLLEHNQVYAEKEDFEFVKSYIMERCTKTKKVAK